MHILFAISALCLFALMLAASAVAWHVRSSQASTHPPLDFAQHLFAAAKDHDSRIPRTLTQQAVKDVMAKKSHQKLHLQASDRRRSISSKPF